MTGRPRLRAHLHVESIDDEGVYLLAEHRHVRFVQPIFRVLIPLLDGQHTVEQLLARVRESVATFDVHQVYGALLQLRRRGVLADGPLPSQLSGAAAAYWESAGLDAGQVAVRLAQARVGVVMLGSAAADPWVEALAELGIETHQGDEATGCDVTVVVVDDYLDPRLAEIDADHRAGERPWVLARAGGATRWIGPLFVPGQTGCWECLASRLRGHRRLETHLSAKTGRTAAWALARAALPSTVRAAAGRLATEIARFVVDRRGALLGAVQTCGPHNFEARAHRLVRRPQCSACGTVPPRDRRPPLPELGDEAGPRVANDAGIRSCTAEATVARLRHHISPITGIIGSMDVRRAEHAEVTPLYVTDHSFVDMDRELYFLREGFRKRSGGKGTTPAQAMASAIGESIERYCGVFRGTEPRRTATMRQLGSAAIEPNAVMGYSGSQFERRAEHNASGSRVRWVPELFDPEASIEWTPLRRLSDGEIRYLPTASCYYGYRPDGPRFAVADSNGCAAGNTFAEATLQGLLELIERDCVALWWYSRVRRAAVDLAAFDEPYLARLQEHYRGLHRELWALDLTHDLGIPTIAAVSRRTDGPHEDIVLGFGCHPDARVALLRAVTELNQSLPSVPREPQPDPARYGGSNRDAVRWWTEATLATEPYLRPDRDCVSSLRPTATAERSAAAMLTDCTRVLAEHGLETLVLDQSRPDIELCVARVVVPGLRHFWARFGPGRLYDVPVSLGWLEHPLTEDQLNPHVVYF